MVPSFRDLQPDSELEKKVRYLLANRQAMEAVRELLLRSDLDALLHLRGIEHRGAKSAESVAEAAAVLNHNERIRGYFRAALTEKQKDPFGI